MTMIDSSTRPDGPAPCPSCACGHGAAAEQKAEERPEERPESARERVNRKWNEVLQETRVAQTGVSILFGFLLSVAFTSLFRDLDVLDHVIYVVTVVLAASATASLIAPVSIHRFLSGLRMKDEIVDAAGRLMACGMVLLALTICGALLLILRVAVPSLLAEVLVGGVMLWFGLCWYVLPLVIRRRAGRRGEGRTAGPTTD
ncbi:DUF6328 family protein [Streptomyces sp. NPDC058372]|uniref:DUF6328 family protein n=1 Tax=unclassified Streptomyces TaxID=2593676 RepID=UPI00365AD06E